MERRRITRPALGCTGQLGDLYDAHTDNFITGNIFGNNLSTSVVRQEDFHNTAFKFDRVNNYESTFQNLEIGAALKLSILSGILSVDGHGKYMSNIKKSNNSNKVTLSLFIKRQREVLRVSFEELSKHIRGEAFADKSATHVVTEVVWGANIFAMFEQQKGSSDERETIEGELAVELNKIGSFFFRDAKANVKAENETKTKVNNLHIEFNGDLEMPGIPTTIPEALKMIKTIPDSMSRLNGGKGVQVQFVLSPIKDVMRYVHSALESPSENLSIREVDEGLVRLIQFTFDQLLIFEQKINQLVKLIEQYRDIYVPFSDVTNMNLEKLRIDTSIGDFRRDLAILLKNLRKSTTTEEEKRLAQQINTLVNNQCRITSNDMEQFLLNYKYLQQKCEIIERLKSMKVVCLKLDQRFHETPENDVYILMTSNHLFKTNLKQFEQISSDFITLINQKKTSRFVFHDQNDTQLTATRIEHQPASRSSKEKSKQCRWGVECRHIKDTEHCREFTHHPDGHQKPCRWGVECRHIKDTEHCREFTHHPDGQQKACRWGTECRHIKDSEHCRKFTHHPDGQQKPCRWGMECRHINDSEHSREFTHHPDSQPKRQLSYNT